MGSEWGHVGSYSVHSHFAYEASNKTRAFAEEVSKRQRVPGWGPMGSVMVLNGHFCCFVEAVRLFCNGVRVGSCGFLQCTFAFR